MGMDAKPLLIPGQEAFWKLLWLGLALTPPSADGDIEPNSFTGQPTDPRLVNPSQILALGYTLGPCLEEGSTVQEACAQL